jgi:hypothetical protein
VNTAGIVDFQEFLEQRFQIEWQVSHSKDD